MGIYQFFKQGFTPGVRIKTLEAGAEKESKNPDYVYLCLQIKIIGYPISGLQTFACFCCRSNNQPKLVLDAQSKGPIYHIQKNLPYTEE